MIGSSILCFEWEFISLHLWSHWEAKMVLCVCEAIDREADLWLVFLLVYSVALWESVLEKWADLSPCSCFFTAEGAENGMDFTIVRPFNWIGPRMDFIPGIDGPSEGVPRVLACFSNVCTASFLLWLLLLLVTLASKIDDVWFSDFAESPTPRATEARGWWPIPKNFYIHQRCNWSSSFDDCTTFLCFSLISNPKVFCIWICLLPVQENPARANGQIFNVGNPNNEVTVKQLAEMMTEVREKRFWF